MKYIASWSGGKDSTASIILAHEHNEPLDLIIFSEVMFDKNVSGELPKHIDFIRNKAIPLFQSWGYETKILHSDRTYMDCFYRKPSRGKFKNSEKRCGFPMMMKCVINRAYCKHEKAVPGTTKCAKCLAKIRTKRQAKRCEIARSERRSYGICYICGKNPVLPRKGACAECYEVRLEAMGKCLENREEGFNTYWKQENKLIFGGKNT